MIPRRFLPRALSTRGPHISDELISQGVNYLSFHHTIEQETSVSYLSDMSYAFIELPKFSKTIHDLKIPEDHWIYAMNHAEVMREAPLGAPEEVRQA